MEFYKKPTDDLINAGSVVNGTWSIDTFLRNLWKKLNKFPIPQTKRLTNLVENLFEEIRYYINSARNSELFQSM